MACALVPFTDDPSLDLYVRLACLEAYHSHMRTLIEFFVKGRGGRDIHRHDFLPGWDPPTGADTARLLQMWTHTSENVSHLSWRRIPAPGEEALITNVAPVNLALLANLVLSLAEDFTQCLEANEHPSRIQFRTAVQMGRSRLR